MTSTPSPRKRSDVSKKSPELQRPAAEVVYAEELSQLEDSDDKNARPQGWRLSPAAVLDFVIGNPKKGIATKFVGERRFIERCIVALATNRGLMLIGEPGTAKSYLSELLCAAISGDSTLTIQGSASTTDDNIKYSWNYALLLAEGPSEKSLVPAPLYRGMSEGKLVRFEEITRCPLEVQDTLLSVLSDRVLSIPELDTDARSLYARLGFNVIATANTRDRGVNEMSAALKRRFNFETVHPIPDLEREVELVQNQAESLLAHANVPVRLSRDLTEVLVSTFHELRRGKTAQGKSVESLSTVMSTAEAVSVVYSSGLHAHFYSGGTVTVDHLVQNIVGTALKDEPEDLNKLRRYFENVIKSRSGRAWKAFYAARKHLR